METQFLTAVVPFLFNILIYTMWCVFFYSVLTRRYSVPVTIAAYAFCLLLYFIIPELAPYASAVRVLSSTVFVVLLPQLILYRDPWYRVLLAVTTQMVTMSISEILASLLMGQHTTSNGIWTETILFQICIYTLYLTFYAMMLGVISLFLNRYKNRITRQDWLILCGYPVSQLILLAGWLQVGAEGIDRGRMLFLLLACAACLVADAALYRTVRGMTQRVRLEIQNANLEKQIDLQKEHYSALTEQYESIRHMRHDIENHLHTIHILLQEDRAEDATAYAAELRQRQSFQSVLGQCENPVADAFLAARIGELKAQNIPVDYTVRLPKELPISNADLISIFGNLLDNAAEACRQVPEGHIRLRAAVVRDSLVIETENPAPPEEPRKRRRIPELERGVGTHILRELAEKYDGSLTQETENGRFLATLTLTLKGETQVCPAS